MFYHEGPAVIRTMRDLMVGVLEHLEIMSLMDLDVRIKYMERLLRVPVLKKYRQVLAECKESGKGLAGNQWTIGLDKVVYM